MAADFVKFLGTAGARFVMARQLRYSAGTFLSLQGQRIMLDPGPGTLLRCAKSRPSIDVTELDAVVLTHAHIDHSGDATALLDAMTAGGFDPRGRLFAPAQCLEGPDAVVLDYVQKGLEEVVRLEPEHGYSIGPLRFSTSPRHRHPLDTYGVTFRPQGGPVVGFLVDTEPFEGLAAAYRGVDLLVVNVVRREPHPSGKVQHLCLDDARELIAEIGPRKAVLTHFGMTMLKAKPWELAQAMSEELGLDVLAASDGMTVDLDELAG